MPAITTCPTTQELTQLLNASLSGERQHECEQHLEVCPDCAAKLEQLAVEGSNLSRVVVGLHEAAAPATSAYWPALNSLNAAAQDSDEGSDSATKPSAKRRDVSLHFLEPSISSEYVGRLGQFDVMRVLGRGGMGIVLEAFDSRLRRNVALKVLDPELLGDDVAKQRFCREARAAASITHENVVAVHQVEKASEGSPPFMVMQLIAGESLEQRLGQGSRLALREVVRIGMQMAHGLAAAHAQGLIHRDIKPGNIMLEAPHDRVKLTDFGLARLEDDMKLTKTGFVSGTPLYMAPEQALGQEADPRSDLFSLGAVLYEMCAGRPPFSGNTALAILKQITEAKPVALRQLNPQAPEWLAETIDRLLAKRPDDRIQTAAHLAELFEFQWALMKATSEDVPTVCAIEQRKRTIRNRWIATAIGSAFLAVGLLAGRYFLPERAAVIPVVPEAQSTAPPLAVFPASAGAVWSVSFDPAGKTVAMPLEGGSVRLLDLATKSVKGTLNAHRGIVWSARFTRDGRHLATAGDDGLVKLWDLDRLEATQTFKHSNGVRSIALSRDDKLLFAGDRAGGIRVWSLETGEPVVEAEHPGAVYALALSPDGETLATAGSDNIVRLWNTKTLVQRLPLEGHTGPVLGLSFHPAGRRLASVGWDKTIHIWDTADGSSIKSWQAHTGDAWSVAYSPDGTKLVTGGTDGAVKLWNAESGQLLATYLGHNNAVHTVAFNDDGKQIASGGRDGAVRIWNVD